MTADHPSGSPPVTVVMISRDRRDQALESLRQLVMLQPGVHVIFVGNSWTDGSADAVADALPEVEVIRLPTNRGAAARNVGVRAARTPYVAFSDAPPGRRPARWPAR